MATRPTFPEGHTVAIAYARVFGPKMKSTPEGHPIQISSAPFDNTVETAVSAIGRAAKKWHGIEPHAPSWQLEFVEDVVPVPGQQAPTYSKVYVFKYLPEQDKWKLKGLDDTKVPNDFKTSHYLTKTWQRTGNAIDQSLASALIPAATTSAPVVGGKA